MKTKDVTQILKTLGWQIDTDEVGDKFALYTLPDRVVQIIYGIDQLIEDQQFSSTLSLSTDAFAKACATIHPDRRSTNYAPLIRARSGLELRAPEILEEHIKQLSDQAITWAKEQDLTAGLQANVDLPTDAPGARPIWGITVTVHLIDFKRQS